MTSSASLAGFRILVVEDDMMIAVVVEEALRGFGCIVVGPVGKLDSALAMAAEDDFDAAILDVTIRGGNVYPVAERLQARGIPFVLASGYGDWALPEAFRDRDRLTKPFTVGDLRTRVQALRSGLAGADTLFHPA